MFSSVKDYFINLETFFSMGSPHHNMNMGYQQTNRLQNVSTWTPIPLWLTWAAVPTQKIVVFAH